VKKRASRAAQKAHRTIAHAALRQGQLSHMHRCAVEVKTNWAASKPKAVESKCDRKMKKNEFRACGGKKEKPYKQAEPLKKEK